MMTTYVNPPEKHVLRLHRTGYATTDCGHGPTHDIYLDGKLIRKNVPVDELFITDDWLKEVRALVGLEITFSDEESS